LERGLYLADQAEGVGVSVPTVSAIERGNRTATVEYAQKVAKWLGLNSNQTSDLVDSLAQVDNVVKFRPRSPEAASFAFNLANRLNSLTPQDIDRMKKILEDGVRIYE
jgi:transcriptional regulator with XRE-family HTH domain